MLLDIKAAAVERRRKDPVVRKAWVIDWPCYASSGVIDGHTVEMVAVQYLCNGDSDYAAKYMIYVAVNGRMLKTVLQPDGHARDLSDALRGWIWGSGQSRRSDVLPWEHYRNKLNADVLYANP